MMMKKSSFIQSHLMRIADYLMFREGVWFETTEDGGLIFLDGKDEPDIHQQGPSLCSFSNTSMKEIVAGLSQKWEACIDLIEEMTLRLPCVIRVYDDTGNVE